MRIILTKLTDERHRLEIHRADGSSESAQLETRSFLLHDLVHLAVESEAKIDDGFWGLLEHGTTLAALSDRTMSNPLSSGIAMAERLVGPMQAVWNDRITPERYVEQANLAFVDIAFVERVRERLRSLFGHWRATKFRESMEVRWPPVT